MPIVNLAILAPFPNLNLLEPLATLLSDALKFVKRRFSEISIVVINGNSLKQPFAVGFNKQKTIKSKSRELNLILIMIGDFASKKSLMSHKVEDGGNKEKFL